MANDPELTPNGVLFTPWRDHLIDTLKAAQRDVFLVSPFIKYDIAKDIFRCLASRGIRVRLISRFSQRDFEAGASDITATLLLSGLRAPQEDLKFRFVPELHAKIFVVDQTVVYLGSSNLTYGGLIRNFESVSVIREPLVLKKILCRLEQLWTMSEEVSEQDFTLMGDRIRLNKAANRQLRHEADHSTPVDDQGFRMSSELLTVENIADVTRSAVPMRVSIPSLHIELTDENTSERDAIAEVTHRVDVNADLSTGEIWNMLPQNEEAPNDADSLSDDEIKKEKIQKLKYIYTHHILISRGFVSRLSTLCERKFNLHERNLLISSISTSDAKSRFAEATHITSSIENKIFSADEVYRPFNSGDAQAGKAVYELAALLGCTRMGIMARYGPAAGNFLAVAAGHREVVTELWHRNLLGPLLTVDESTVTNDRSLENSFWHLLLELSRILGLSETITLVEEYFNPFDAVGSDIGTLLASRGAKTRLQEIMLSVGQRLPHYLGHEKNGGEHDPVWSCHVEVDKNISAEGQGPNKSQAELSAASEALKILEESTYWKKVIENHRSDEFRKFESRRPTPVFPRYQISPELSAKVAAAYKTILNVQNLDPALGLSALLDVGSAMKLRISDDNRSLATIGARLVGYLLQAERPVWSIAKSPSYPRLIRTAKVDELRRELKLPELGSKDGQINCIQSVVAALYFTGGYSLVRDILMAAAQSAWETETENSHESFIPDFDYKAALQTLTLSIDHTLPSYTFSGTQGPAHQPLHRSEVAWGGMKGIGVGTRRKAAENAAAFELLRLLNASERSGAEPV